MSKITILLATYNGELYISQMIESIVKQTFTDWTLILSDDGSTDRTVEILDDYAKKYPENIIHYRSGKKFGCAQKHFMHLLSIFHNTPYIMFCDQDDVWHSDKIDLTMSLMNKIEDDVNKPVMIHTDLRVVDKNLDEISPSFCKSTGIDGNRTSLTNLLVQNVVTGCTMMINNTLANLACRDIADGAMLMHDWWLALLATACGKVGFLNKPTIDYRQHGNNSVGASDNHSFVTVFNKLKSNKMRKTLTNAAVQAGHFLNCYDDILSNKNKKILSDFYSTHNKCFLKRDLIYIKHKLFRKGFFSIIIQLLGL